MIVEGNHYFPPDSVRQEYFKPSSTHTVCPGKGTASYYDIEVNGRVRVLIQRGDVHEIRNTGRGPGAP